VASCRGAPHPEVLGSLDNPANLLCRWLVGGTAASRQVDGQVLDVLLIGSEVAAAELGCRLAEDPVQKTGVQQPSEVGETDPLDAAC